MKPRAQASEEVLARRSRKNAQSRSRAAKFRQRVLEIEKIEVVCLFVKRKIDCGRPKSLRNKNYDPDVYYFKANNLF